MLTIKEVVTHTGFSSIATEFEIHYGGEHLSTIKSVYDKLLNTPSESNKSNMIVFIRTLKENEHGEYEVVEEYENNDNTLWFDVSGEDNKYDGLYSIASSEYGELLGYYVDQSTIERFSYAQILAHIIWEIEWR